MVVARGPSKRFYDPRGCRRGGGFWTVGQDARPPGVSLLISFGVKWKIGLNFAVDRLIQLASLK